MEGSKAKHIDSALINDLSIQIRIRASIRDSLKQKLTYQEFCSIIFQSLINQAKAISACRIDIVADTYQSHSIKISNKHHGALKKEFDLLKVIICHLKNVTDSPEKK